MNAATLNLSSRDWPTPPSTRFWPYTDRDLPILATLVSSHPVLATFCCILLLFTSLVDFTSLVQEIPRPDDVGAGGKLEKVIWALATSEFRLL